ncbi:MAG: hypothetical protein ACC652_13955, partial [Acidimicrobiales bacterium]
KGRSAPQLAGLRNASHAIEWVLWWLYDGRRTGPAGPWDPTFDPRTTGLADTELAHDLLRRLVAFIAWTTALDPSSFEVSNVREAAQGVLTRQFESGLRRETSEADAIRATYAALLPDSVNEWQSDWPGRTSDPSPALPTLAGLFEAVWRPEIFAERDSQVQAIEELRDTSITTAQRWLAELQTVIESPLLRGDGGRPIVD